MRRGSYAFFDHTGDFGVEVEGADRSELVELTAKAFLELLTGDASCVAALEGQELALEGLDAEDVLVAFGNELLFRFEAEGFLWSRFEAREVTEDRIEGTLWGEAFRAKFFFH